MSYDLHVWNGSYPLSMAEYEAAFESDSGPDNRLVWHSEAVDAFYRDLTAIYPDWTDETSDEEIEALPWSIEIQRAPGSIELCIVWSRAHEVRRAVRDLARRHGLLCFDPQEGLLEYPGAYLSPWQEVVRRLKSAFRTAVAQN